MSDHPSESHSPSPGSSSPRSTSSGSTSVVTNTSIPVTPLPSHWTAAHWLLPIGLLGLGGLLPLGTVLWDSPTRALQRHVVDRSMQVLQCKWAPPESARLQTKTCQSNRISVSPSAALPKQQIGQIPMNRRDVR